ncbi:MAG: peptidoglycan-binding domain-containing protein [Spirulinaceae cyanobacterium]
MTSFSHHPAGEHQTAKWSDTRNSLFIAQAEPGVLEDALEPQFSTEAPTSAVSAYFGLIILSVLTFVFLLFLLTQRRFKEARFGIFATLLLGAALPIWLSVEFILVDYLGVKEPGTVTASPSPTTPVAETDGSASEAPEAEPSESDPSESDSSDSGRTESEAANAETSESTSIAAIGLAQQVNELDLALEFPEFWDELVTTAAQAVADQDAAENNLNPSDNPDAVPGRSSPDLLDNDNNHDSNNGAATADAAAAGAPASITQGGNLSAPAANNAARSGNASTAAIAARPSQNALRPSPPPPPSLSRVDFNAPIALRPVLRQGLTGQDVIVLQKLLKDLGFYDAEPDGYFGQQTTLAVQDFQKEHNLLTDGIVGFSTCQILTAQVSTVELQCRE